jgi:hypothetical protein
LPSRRIPEAARQSPACDIKKEQGTKPCSSHIEILIPDFYSRYVRGGGVFFRAEDLFPSQDLDRSLGPA